MTSPAAADSILFRPLALGPYEIPGRVFKSATSETRADDHGFVTEELLAFYEPVARAKTPLIVTGNLYVSRQGCSTHREAGIDDDDKIPGLREWAQIAHRHGSALVAQLNHAGRQVGKLADGVDHAVSASDVREPILGTNPRPLTTEGIRQVVDDFAAAAVRAAEAEMDGVQIHLAHGYLLGQFLTPHTNRRRDDYGGSLDNRMRIVLEVLREIKARVGDDFLVIAKINGSDDLPLRRAATTAELLRVAQAMQDEGLHGIEISRGHYESGLTTVRGRFDGFVATAMTEGAGRDLARWRRSGARLASPMIGAVANRLWPFEEGFNLSLAERFTGCLDIPVICVGGFHTREGMEKPIETGRCDAVSAARAMIADPMLYRHLRFPDRLVQPCTFTNGCIARAGGRPAECYAPAISGPPRTPIELRTETVDS